MNPPLPDGAAERARTRMVVLISGASEKTPSDSDSASGEGVIAVGSFSTPRCARRSQAPPVPSQRPRIQRAKPGTQRLAVRALPTLPTYLT